MKNVSTIIFMNIPFFSFFKMALRVNVKWNVEVLGETVLSFLRLEPIWKAEMIFFSFQAKLTVVGINLWKNPFINFLVEFNLSYTKWMEEEDFRSFLAYFKLGNIWLFSTQIKKLFCSFYFHDWNERKNPQINFSNQNLSIESTLTKIWCLIFHRI